MEKNILAVITTISFDSILSIIKKIHYLMDIILDSDHHDLKSKIMNLDLSDKLKEIEAFMRDLQNLNLDHSKESLVISVDSLHKSIELIHNSLEQLSVKILEHKEKYLSSWRSVDYNNHYEDIAKYDSLLTLRYNRVKDLLKIPWNQWDFVNNNSNK